MIKRSLAILAAALLLGACMPEEEAEFCSHHARFHAGHAATNAKLAIAVRADGTIETELELPLTRVDESTARQLLRDAASVYTLQSASACASSSEELGSAGGVLTARYRSHCGSDNKLGQLDILLFDNLPALDEVEVTVVTPATEKRFAINRACESAIFRLE